MICVFFSSLKAQSRILPVDHFVDGHLNECLMSNLSSLPLCKDFAPIWLLYVWIKVNIGPWEKIIGKPYIQRKLGSC